MNKPALGIILVIATAMVPFVSFAEETKLPTLEELFTAMTGLIDRVEEVEIRLTGLEELEARVGKLELSVSSQSGLTPTPSPETPTATPCHTFQRYDAQEVIDHYGESKDRADKKHKNALFEVAGKIARIDDDDGELYIIFNIAGGPDNFRCNFAPGQESEWSSLRKGDRVVVLGVGRGKNRTPWGDFNLDGCTLVETP